MNQRTAKQNNAMWLYCELVAHALNMTGQTKTKLYAEWAEKGREVPWSKNSIKEDFWDVLNKAIQNHDSTTEQSTTDFIEVYEVMSRKLAERGIDIPWPSDEPEMIGTKK